MTSKVLGCVIASFALIVGADIRDARGSTLTFDNFTSLPAAAVPNGYGGLNWGTGLGFINAIDPTFAPSSGIQNGLVSPSYDVINNGGNTVDITPASGSASFDFISAYLTGAWRDGLQVTLTGFLGGSQLFQQTVSVNTAAPTLFQFNFTGIDDLRLTTFGGGAALPGCTVGTCEEVVLDNVTVNTVAVNAVPEPASLVLLGAGLLGGAARRRREKRAAQPVRRIDET